MINTLNYARVTVGGGVIGAGGGHVRFNLVCPACKCPYPMAMDPVGLALSPAGAAVLEGYVERCPHCKELHQAGAVLGVQP